MEWPEYIQDEPDEGEEAISEIAALELRLAALQAGLALRQMLEAMRRCAEAARRMADAHVLSQGKIDDAPPSTPD